MCWTLKGWSTHGGTSEMSKSYLQFCFLFNMLQLPCPLHKGSGIRLQKGVCPLKVKNIIFASSNDFFERGKFKTVLWSVRLFTFGVAERC